MKIINSISEVPKHTDSIFIHFTGSMLGISCFADNRECINKINKLKERSNSKGLIVLFDSLSTVIKELNLYNLDKSMNRFLKRIWLSNTTVLLENKNPKYEHLTVDNKLAVRIPTDPMLRAFIEENSPIVSTSINKSGEQAIAKLEDMSAEFLDVVDFALIPPNFEKASNEQSTIIDIYENSPKLVRQGSVDFADILLKWNIIRICFACVANVCRSPIAEYYAIDSIKIPDKKLIFSSCGYLIDNKPISKNSAIVLASWGIDTSDHRSRILNKKILADNDYILTMTLGVKNVLLEIFPLAANKIFTIGEITGTNMDIEDPFGLEIEHYIKMAEIVKKEVDKLAEIIKNNQL
ncbi:MAG: Sua5/YciO/YrdC/YwlC family protein [Candidatus Cloacimonadales bacterium]|jgi:protein-tyrosine phosphatase|nr:Sua5/YciO/YrdC/YwlC family protein [Candidatus Cloacimonadota bacterium]MDD2650558.1 Sua5/YciO/YrdC/YwlC family protein [Candidatus Cloacimonadota bacterium]MDX9978058.1 Sua5/YciO/YrdC/YwlC family protein [Candidatus Cloacimonadales bacterium]